MALLRHALAAAALLTLAGCGGRSAPPSPPPQTPATAEPTELRKDFIILRELVKQHALQTEAGNEARVEAVERHLKSRLSSLPDSGQTPAEQEILAQAQALAGE
jgi:predicted small lipoprotein YifL